MRICYSYIRVFLWLCPRQKVLCNLKHRSTFDSHIIYRNVNIFIERSLQIEHYEPCNLTSIIWAIWFLWQWNLDSYHPIISFESVSVRRPQYDNQLSNQFYFVWHFWYSLPLFVRHLRRPIFSTMLVNYFSKMLNYFLNQCVIGHLHHQNTTDLDYFAKDAPLSLFYTTVVSRLPASSLRQTPSNSTRYLLVS